MSFRKDHDEIFKKYNTILTKIEGSRNIELFFQFMMIDT